MKVLGRVVADVRATGKVEIWKGGHLVGDVKARTLDIEEGAYFTGRSEMVGEDGKAIALPGADTQSETRGAAALPPERLGFDAARFNDDSSPLDSFEHRMESNPSAGPGTRAGTTRDAE